MLSYVNSSSKLKYGYELLQYEADVAYGSQAS